MSNLIKEVEINRSSRNGHYLSLGVEFNIPNTIVWISEQMSYTLCSNEDEGAVQVLDRIDDCVSDWEEVSQIINLQQLRLKVTEGFRQLRENDLSGNSRETMKVSLVPEAEPDPHFSCKMNNKEYDTTQSSGENEISQSEVQQKLAIVKKEHKVMKFFENNNCSVCLRSYKEILYENRHIVIPSCGHPLCCDCADNILKSTKKCPRCRGNITADSFNLMKFNAGLQMEAQDQIVFL